MPTWRELRRYCDKAANGWELYKETDHRFYRKRAANGEIWYTKISKGTGEIGPGLMAQILKRQLHITDEFLKFEAQMNAKA